MTGLTGTALWAACVLLSVACATPADRDAGSHWDPQALFDAQARFERVVGVDPQSCLELVERISAAEQLAGAAADAVEHGALPAADLPAYLAAAADVLEASAAPVATLAGEDAGLAETAGSLRTADMAGRPAASVAEALSRLGGPDGAAFQRLAASCRPRSRRSGRES